MQPKNITNHKVKSDEIFALKNELIALEAKYQRLIAEKSGFHYSINLTVFLLGCLQLQRQLITPLLAGYQQAAYDDIKQALVTNSRLAAADYPKFLDSIHPNSEKYRVVNKYLTVLTKLYKKLAGNALDVSKLKLSSMSLGDLDQLSTNYASILGDTRTSALQLWGNRCYRYLDDNGFGAGLDPDMDKQLNFYNQVTYIATTVTFPLVNSIYNLISGKSLYFSSFLSIQTYRPLLNTNLNANEIKKLCESYSEKNDQLEKYLKYKNIAHLLTLTSFVFIGYLSLQQQDIPLEFSILLTIFLTNTLLAAFREGMRVLNIKRLDNDLERHRNFYIHAIEKKYLESCQIYKGNDLSTSLIILKFRQFNNISSAKVCQMAKNILLQHGFYVAVCSKSLLSIKTTGKIDQVLIKVLQDKIDSMINRYADCSKLTDQIQRVAQLCNAQYLVLPERDTENMPSMRAILTVAEDCLEQLYEILTKTFTSCRIHINDQNQIMLVGSNSIQQDRITEFATKHRGLINRTLARSIPGHFAEKNTEGKRHYPKDKEKVEESRAQTRATQPFPVRIDFPSGRYDSHDPHCKIYELSGRGLPKATFFVKFDLRPENFGARADSYEKFKTMAEAAHLAPSRKGEIGAVFVDRWVRDKNGLFFHASLMFKALGEHGDERVFCKREKSITDNKELYVACGYEPHAH